MKDKSVLISSAILAGGLFSVHSNVEVRILVLAFILLIIIHFWFFWKPLDFYGRLSKPEIMMLMCALLVGFLYGFTAERSIPSPLIEDRIKVEGRLTDWTTEERSARGIIVLDTVVSEKQISAQIGRKYNLRVYADSKGNLSESWSGVKPGDKLSFTAKLEHPQPPGTEGEFDLPLYNAVRGLSGSLTARGGAEVVEKGSPPLSWSVREKVRNVLAQYWEEDAPVLEGIMFGDSSRIPQETLDMYKATGVMHVFAASGANVAFVIALFWTAFFFLPPKARIAFTLTAVIFYAFLCQGNPPILRATILGAAVLLGMLGRGKVSSLRWLLFAALILFLWNPLFLRDVSFQLSFAAAWGLVVISPLLLESRLLQKLPSLVRMPAAVAFSVQIAAMPILIEVFQRISLAGFITNIFILFILGIVLQLGIIGTALIFLPVIPLAFFQVSFWLLAVTDHILNIFASFPFAYLWVLQPGMLFWLMWYTLIAVILIGRERVWFISRVQLRKLNWIISGIPALRHISTRLMGLRSCGQADGSSAQKEKPADMKVSLITYSIVTFGIVVLLIWSPWQGDEKLQVTFLDVGQGDSILIRTPQENLLVDTGPGNDSFDSGERIIVPYLIRNRISQLDMLFITHEDTDHLGGAGYILANIPADRIAVPDVGERLMNEEWQNGLWKYHSFESDKIVKLGAGDTLKFASGLAIEVLSPGEPLSYTSADANNNSLVLLLNYQDTKILLTGDMESEQMQSISDRGADFDADFIKIPHHGARGSLVREWFDRTEPIAVFISVGRNSFGHPSQEVLTYWESRGIPVYRTDIHGTIELIVDTKGISILTGRTG